MYLIYVIVFTAIFYPTVALLYGCVGYGFLWSLGLAMMASVVGILVVAITIVRLTKDD